MAILACFSQLYTRARSIFAPMDNRYVIRALYALGALDRVSGNKYANYLGIEPYSLRQYVRPLVNGGYIRRRILTIPLYRMTELGRLEWERLNSLGMFEGMERECELARERLARRQAKKGVRSIPLDRSNDNDLGV